MNRTSVGRWALTIAAPITIGLSIEPAAAQLSGGSVEEIVVTTRKREERLIDVPLAITAFDSETLARAGVRDLRDLALRTPGMTMFQFGGEFFTAPVIRGIAQTQVLRNSEANVATFLDGVYVINTGAVNLALMDFERIEVVKGPVSSLYGRNAFAGAINYVSKRPGNDPEARVEATFGNYGKYRIAAAAGGPLVVDRLAVRVAGAYDRFDGTYRDVVNGRHLSGFKKGDGQVTVRFTPNDVLAVDGAVYYGDDRFAANARVPLTPNCALARGSFQVYCGLIPDAADLPSPQAPTLAPPELTAGDRNVVHARLRGEFALGDYRLDLLTGYFDVKNRTYVDLNARRDGLSYPLIPGPGRANMNVFAGNDFNSQDVSQEVRLSSPQKAALRWTTGGFYFRSKQITTAIFGSDRDQLPTGQTVGGLPALWLTPGGRISPVQGLVRGTARQVSGFAGVDYDVFSATTASAEVRYTNERKFQDILSVASAVGQNPDGNGLSKSYGYWDTRLSLIHKLTESTRVYASAAHGTKAGGFNSGATIPSDFSFGPEKNWTYEVGFKGSFGSATLNAAAFYIDWRGIQQAALPDDPNNPATVTKNFGDARSLGFELESTLRLAEGISANGGLAYSQPRFRKTAFDLTSFGTFCAVIPTCAPRSVTISGRLGAALGGTPLPRTSDWQVNAGLDVEQPLTGVWNWIARADFAYLSKQYQRNLALNYISSRISLNLRAGLKTDRYSITAWVDNATDDSTPNSTGAFTRLDTFVGEEVANLQQRRTFGVTLSAKF